jgi:RimJ/RimL family protein N-acetyltransferase
MVAAQLRETICRDWMGSQLRFKHSIFSNGLGELAKLVRQCGDMSDIKPLVINSLRLRLKPFQLADAADVFACITPSITRFLPWEPPASFNEYLSHHEQRIANVNGHDFAFVIRRHNSRECLGMTSVEGVNKQLPELGIWLKEVAHGQGYAREAVRAVADWARAAFDCEHYQWPVAAENLASRRIAESMNGVLFAERSKPKYNLVVYKVR